MLLFLKQSDVSDILQDSTVEARKIGLFKKQIHAF